MNAKIVSLSLVLAMSAATAAQAGSALVINGAPNPSSIGQTVTFSASYPGCPGTATFRDGQGGPVLCTATVPTSGTGTCQASFSTAGARTVAATTTACAAPTTTYQQVVNAAAATVPTMGEWMMMALAGLLLVGGGVFVARRTRQA